MERLTLFRKLNHRYRSEQENLLANNLLRLSGVVVGLSVLVLLSSFLFLPNPTLELTVANYLRIISVGLLGLVLGFALPNLVQRGRLEPAKRLLVATCLLLTIPILPLWGGISRPQVMVLVLPIVLAVQILRQRAVLLSSLGVVILVIVATGLQIQSQSFSGRNALNDALDVFIILVVIVAITVQLRRVSDGARSIRQGIASSFLTQVDLLTDQITVLSESQRINQIMQAVYPHIYYVQYYRLNTERNMLERVLTLDNTPNLFLAEIALSDANPISEAARIQQSIRIDTSANLNRHVNFKAGANYQVIYPIVADRKTIGVVDLQFEAHTSTSDADVQEIQHYLKTSLLLNHYATQARLSQDRSFALQEENRLLEERLARVSAQRQGELQSVWGEYINQRSLVNTLGFALQDGNITASDALPAHILANLEQRDVYLTHDEQGNQLLLLAVRTRGQLLVALTFTFPPTQYIGQQQIAVAQRIAERLGTALQTTRLLEETRSQAQRERLATEFGNLLMRSPDITTLLNLATQRLNETLGSVQTNIAVDIGWAVESESGLVYSQQHPSSHAEAKNNGGQL